MRDRAVTEPLTEWLTVLGERVADMADAVLTVETRDGAPLAAVHRALFDALAEITRAVEVAGKDTER